MNRAELVEAMAQQTGSTKTAMEEWLNAFTGTVQINMKKKEGVKLVGFGTFKTTFRNARIGRNPKTGEEVKIPARNVPVFKPGKELKEKIIG